MIPVAVFIVCIVFVLIIVRNTGKIKLPIWFIMTSGAVAALIFQCITPTDAFFSINFEVIAFLFLMFVFGAALDKSGILHNFSAKTFVKAKTKRGVLLIFIVFTAIASAFLMNDTMAVIGTSVALFCAKRYAIPAKIMLLSLCFSVTFGSSVTPMGNPQNLLIAMSGGVSYAFFEFALYLLVPAVLSLAFVYFILAARISNTEIDTYSGENIYDKKLSKLCKVSVVLIIAMIVLRTVLLLFSFELSFAFIALAAAAPLLLFSKRRFELLRGVDYQTLLFFASMFVLMAAVWNSGFILNYLPESVSSSIPVLMISGVVVSQFVSNVPFVLAVIPLLESAGAGVAMYMTAAAAATSAGTLTLLGAASTVIVIQNAEKSGESLSFLDYLKTGFFVTVVSGIIYCVWIGFVACLGAA